MRRNVFGTTPESTSPTIVSLNDQKISATHSLADLNLCATIQKKSKVYCVLFFKLTCRIIYARLYSKMNFIICMDLRELPKIDLHCHLDACVRVSTVAEIGKQLGLVLPDCLEAALIAPPVCDGLMDYLRRIDLALEAMQREG